MQKNSCLVISGFHRSATSVTANWFADAGLNMGLNLLKGHISNPHGHFEDLEALRVHDELLSESGTDWRYYDQTALPELKHCCDRLKPYIDLRNRQNMEWGVKDPRAILFLEAWRTLLAERGHYLFIVRHWGSCVESILNRQSRELAHRLPKSKGGLRQLSFWQDFSLAAKMWLSYNQRLLQFSYKFPDKVLVCTQRALFEGCDLVGEVMQRWQFDLDSTTAVPFRKHLLRDGADIAVRDSLSKPLRQSLENLWDRLLMRADYAAKVEEPSWTTRQPLPERWRAAQTRAVNLISYGHESVGAERETTKDCISKPLLKQLESAGKEAADLSAVLEGNTQLGHACTVEQVLTVIKEFCEVSSPVGGEVFLACAKWLQGLGCYLEAVSYFQQSIAAGIDRPVSYMHIGECYESLGQDEVAENYYSLAKEKNPLNPWFDFKLGGIYKRRGDHAQARALLKEVCVLKPNNIRFLLSYCECLDHVQETQEALNALEEAPVDHSLRMYQMARANYLFKIDYLKGLQVYQQAIGQSLRNNNLEEWLAMCLSGLTSEVAMKDLSQRVAGHWHEVLMNDENESMEESEGV